VIAPSDARRVRVPQGPPEMGGVESAVLDAPPVSGGIENEPRRRGSLREVLPQALGGSERKRTNKFRAMLHCERSWGRVPLRRTRLRPTRWRVRVPQGPPEDCRGETALLKVPAIFWFVSGRTPDARGVRGSVRSPGGKGRIWRGWPLRGGRGDRRRRGFESEDQRRHGIALTPRGGFEALRTQIAIWADLRATGMGGFAFPQEDSPEG